jgi:hypothetical protein
VGVAVIHADEQTDGHGEAHTRFSYANALNKVLRFRLLQVALDKVQSWDMEHKVTNGEVPYMSDCSLLMKGLCSVEFLVFMKKCQKCGSNFEHNCRIL